MKGKHVVIGIVLVVVLFIAYGVISWHGFHTSTFFTRRADCMPQGFNGIDPRMFMNITDALFGKICVTY
jgi:hypothetical protein